MNNIVEIQGYTLHQTVCPTVGQTSAQGEWPWTTHYLNEAHR